MQIETCEICGQQFIAGYGYSIAASWLVTGHASVAAYMCSEMPGGQHWGCSPQHAVLALQQCLEKHMHVEGLIERHVATGKPRYSSEDANWARQWPDDAFHIVTVRRRGDVSDINSV